MPQSFRQIIASIILAVAVLALSTISLAQENKTLDVFYYYDHEIFLDHINEYLEMLTAELSIHNISINFVQDYSLDTAVDYYVIKFWTNFDGERIAESLSVEFYLPEVILSKKVSVLSDNFLPDRGSIITASVQQAARLSTALVLYSLNRCKDAMPYLIESLPDRQATLYYANCALLNEDYETAISTYQSVLYDMGGSAYTQIAGNIAWAQLQLNRQTDALETLDLIKESDRNALPGSDSTQLTSNQDFQVPELYILRGQIYLSLYEWDKSLEDYNTAIELDPDHAEAYFYRGILYYSILQTGQELRKEALADFQHYLDLVPDGELVARAERYVTTLEAELAALDE